MKTSKKLILLLVTICCLLGPASTAYVKLTNIDDYYWNWVLWYISYTKQIYCSFMGLWGVFMLNDNGIMMENCLITGRPGARVTYKGYPPVRRNGTAGG